NPRVSDYRSDLSLALTSLATILDNRKQLAEAEKALSEALDIQRKVIGAWPDVPVFQWHLSLIYYKQAGLFESSRRFREAEEACRKALPLHNRLASDFPTTADYQDQLIETTSMMAHLLLLSGRVKEGLSLHEQLVKKYPKAPQPRQRLAMYLGNLGMHLFFARRQAEEAKKALRRGLEMEENLVKEYPKQ